MGYAPHFYGIPTATSRVTRLRADLAKAALATDLVMTASKAQAVLSNVQVTKENGQPNCPIWNGCTPAGQAPRDEAQARAGSGGDETFSCATAPNRSAPWLEAGAGFAALALAHAMRRRRSAGGGRR